MELRASHLLGRHSTTLKCTLARFALVIFGIGAHCMPGPAWTAILRGNKCTQLLRWACNFLPRLALNQPFILSYLSPK
jgi:hypothetical protein